MAGLAPGRRNRVRPGARTAEGLAAVTPQLVRDHEFCSERAVVLVLPILVRPAAPRSPGEIFGVHARFRADERRSVGKDPVCSKLLRSPEGSLLERKDVDGPDVWITCQQVDRNLGQGGRDLAVDVRGAGAVGGEGVEDAVAGIADLERIPMTVPSWAMASSRASLRNSASSLPLPGWVSSRASMPSVTVMERCPFWEASWLES